MIRDGVWQLRQTESDLFYQVFRSTDPVTSGNTNLEKGTSCARGGKQGKKQKVEMQCVKTENIKEGSDIQEPFAERLKSNQDIIVKHEGIAAADKVTVVTKSYVDHCVKESQDEDILTDYFQLGINLEDLYKKWAKADEHFDRISKQFTGIRMLRQDPVECLFSFICSSNNHISRITSMVDKLAEHYGTKIETGHSFNGHEFYTFPRVAALAGEGVEENLRKLGFGYRAKYIQQSARLIEEYGGEDWLHSLRNMEYKEAKVNLIKLCGVGAKVADCVALMCLDKPGSIPVDTHVWQIAARDYMPKLKQAKSLTDKLYDEIGDFFRSLWGDYAGWAHSVLFTADLRQFKEVKEVPSKKISKRKGAKVDEEVKVKVNTPTR